MSAVSAAASFAPATVCGARMPTSSTARSSGSSSQATPEPNRLPKSQPLPAWVPVSLLALTTAALVVPVVLLKRHRATALSKALQEAPPPPRRTSIIGGVIPNTPTPVRLATTVPRVPQAAPSVSSAQAADDFNGALYSAKAFGYATLMVMTGGAVTVWGVKTYMGVKDTQEFADRMRHIVRTKIPAFSSRLYRAPEEDDHMATLWNSPDTVGEAPAIALDPNAQWSWPDAERRLTTAFETGGFSGWARVALQELEAEGQVERRKRGHE